MILRGCQRWQVIGIAGQEGIAAIALSADTNRSVIDHTADCIEATHADTGIHALGVHTSLVRTAVTVEHALGATTLVGIAEVTLAADTGQASTLSLTFRVCSALQLGTTGRRCGHHR